MLKRCVINVCTSQTINNLQRSSKLKSLCNDETACHKTNRVRVYLPLLSWLSLGWSWLVQFTVPDEDDVRQGRGIDMAPADLMLRWSLRGGAPNVQNTGISCGSFLTVFRSADRRWYSGYILWDLGVTSPKIEGGARLTSCRTEGDGGMRGGGWGDRVFMLMLSGSTTAHAFAGKTVLT